MGEAAKGRARRALRARRDAMPVGERAITDARIRDRVLALDEFRRADAVLCYLAFTSEVETREIISAALAAGKVAALPRCLPGGRLAWHAVRVLPGCDPVAGADGFAHSRMGMLEPVDDPVTLVDPAALGAAVALVPGLAFDRAGYRLGYGGGYYDRFLASFGGVSIGLCRASSLLDDLRGLGMVEAHDRPVDLVVTEGGVLGCRACRACRDR